MRRIRPLARLAIALAAAGALGATIDPVQTEWVPTIDDLPLVVKRALLDLAPDSGQVTTIQRLTYHGIEYYSARIATRYLWLDSDGRVLAWDQEPDFDQVERERSGGTQPIDRGHRTREEEGLPRRQ